ncbi:MAG: GHKL domain-containing protein [Lachnospiraceae bacterium]|nr:GHKL domain-containing protein [Lachnospiraceae bacterium]
MDVYEWIYLMVVEGIKYVLVAHYFFGYEFNRKKTKYLLVLYPLMIPVVQMAGKYIGIFNEIVYSYKNLWGLFLLLFIMRGKAIDKMKSFLLMWFFASMVDTIMFFPALMFTKIEEQDIQIKMFWGCIGAVFWIIAAFKAKEVQKRFQLFLQGMSFFEYCLLLLALFIVSLALGGMQGYWYGAITSSKKDVIFLLDIIAAIIFMVICVLLFYTRQTKAHLEEMNEANLRYLALQHQYYKSYLMQYEDMRSYQHDINKHIFLIGELCRKNKFDELKDYVERLAECYDKVRTVHTGNLIADTVISYSLGALRSEGNFRFQLDGHFPEKFFMEDVDFCVLLSNLLDNAKEALEKVEGMRLIQMEVKRFQEKLYLTVSNNVAGGQIDFGHTSKEDKLHHGYGVRNIRRVVEKYNGTVQWRQECGMAVVSILFLCVEEQVPAAATMEIK